MIKFFILLGNFLPPPLNKYFYKFAGVKFKNIKKCWIGMFNHIDNYDPSMISIGENVCVSYKVLWVTHFDPSKSIKNHIIKNYKKEIIIEDDVFIGAGSILCPGIILKKNSFISTGSVVKSNVEPYEIVEGNPAKKVGLLENK